MKAITKTIVAALAISASTILLTAQNQEPVGPPPGDAPADDQGPRHRRMHGHRPPPPPIIVALDANKDGTIDAAEIENSVAALKTLDKDADGALSREELRPPRPEGAPQGGPEGEGPRGPRGGKGHRGGPHGPPPCPPEGEAPAQNL